MDRGEVLQISLWTRNMVFLAGALQSPTRHLQVKLLD